MPCPEHELFVCYVEDLLGPAARAALEEHADGCPPCRRLLSQLAMMERGPNTVQAAAPTPAVAAERGSLEPGTAAGRDVVRDRRAKSAAYPLKEGDRLGRYRIRSLLGRGGASAVYRAAEIEGGREVALKVHAPFSGDDAGWRWRLRREFFLMAQWHHPHIVPVLDWGEHDGLIYYVMELVEGRDASGLAPMRPDDVIEIMRAVVSALGMVHNHGLLHRDIKPHNILIPFGPGGEFDAERALLMDFGLLVRLDEGVIDGSGTPGFMAPERLLGAPADVRGDLYGLGATAFALLAGASPPLRFKDESPVSLPRDVPDQLAILIGELLAPDPRLRPRSAPEVLARLAPPRRAEVEPVEPVLVRAVLRSPPLIEREEALSELRQVWAETLAGRGGGPAFVVSAPGLGRSRMLRQFALELRAAGVSVAEAAGGPGAPLDLVAQLLRPMAAYPELGSLADGLLGRAAQSPTAELGALARQAVRLLASAARVRPIALCIDDLDLADEASLEVVEQVSRVARGLPLLLLCSMRLGPADARASLARLRRSALHVCVLERLSRAGVERMMEGLFGQHVATATLVEQLDQASGGNAKVLLALLETLIDEGRALSVAGRWRLPRHVDGLERLRGPDDMLEASRSGLSPAGRALADLLSLRRDPVELNVLAAASRIDRQRFLQALEELRERHLIRTGAHATVSIADPLVAASLEAAQSKESRRRGHATLAAALRTRYQDVGLDDHHRAQLELHIGRHELSGGSQLEGARWLIRGCRRLVAQGVFSAAIEPLREATEILEQRGGAERHPELLELWEELGVASLMRDGGLSLACFERMVRHLDRDNELSAIARAGRRFGRRMGLLGGVATTLGRRIVKGRWREALRLPSEANRYVRGLAYLGVVEAQVALLDSARDHIEQLEAFARARGRDAEAVAIVARAHWSFSMGRLDEVKALTRTGLSLLQREPGALEAEHARRARSSLDLIGAWVDALTASPGFRHLDLASAAIDEMFEMHTLMLPAVHHAARGEIRELLEARALLFARCFRLRSGWQEAFIYAPTAPALMDAGLVAQLQDDVALLFDLDVPPSPWREIIRRTVPGMLLLAQGSCDRAAEMFDEAHRVARSEASGSVMYLIHALQLAAEAHLDAGRHHEAEPRLRDVIAMAEAPDTRHPPASIRARRVLLRSTLARRDVGRAARLLDESGEPLRRVDLPGERAAFCLLEAELALDAGDMAAAAHGARTAQEMFVKLGNPLGAERALALRRRSGDDASNDTTGSPAADTGPHAAGATVTMTASQPAADGPTELDPARPVRIGDPRRG